jgi:predicted RNase H-like nuclease
MRAVMGIDAAWTARQPSGVALCVERGGRWACRGVAPSYSEFVGCADGKRVDWERPAIGGGAPDPARILAAARRLAPGATIEAVAVDMPLARSPIRGRRGCDQAISREYGGRHCSTHSPSRDRPGPLSAAIRDGFAASGFRLATRPSSPRPALLEVYPHPALLSLTGAEERLRYKVSRSGRYWPDAPAASRRERLVAQWDAILRHLRRRVSLDLELPRAFATFAAMKRYEDAIDAVVCAWVAIRFLDGEARPFGDDDAAIWCPA